MADDEKKGDDSKRVVNTYPLIRVSHKLLIKFY